MDSFGGKNLDWLRAHFRKHRNRTPWDFCWRTGIEGVLVSFLVVVILSFFIDVPEREFVHWPIHVVILVVLILAPVLETVFLQAIPVTVAKFFKAGMKIQILVSLLIFSLLHFSEGLAVGVGAGLIGGFYLAFTYAHWAQKSVWKALWVTAVAHVIRNTLPTIVLVLLYAF
jgi:hypothetical protein